MGWGKTLAKERKRVVLEISGYLERGQAENRVNEFFGSSSFLLPLFHLSNPLSPTSLLNRTAWAALEWVSIQRVALSPPPVVNAQGLGAEATAGAALPTPTPTVTTVNRRAGRRTLLHPTAPGLGHPGSKVPPSAMTYTPRMMG